MIRYVQNKPINYARISQLLEQSQQAGIFTNNGPNKQLLEKLLAKKFQIDPSKRIVCTSSGASALYVLMNLFEKKSKKSLTWATPAFNFPAATINKLNTDILDIDLTTYTLSIDKLSPYDGVIITTLFGTVPNNLLQIQNYCIKNNKILILDNASSPLSCFQHSNINNYGHAAIGSNHHTKYFGTGEGGYAVVPTEMYDDLNALTNFGFNDTREHCSFASNAKMSDIAAAFIISHIETYNVTKHLEIQEAYIQNIQSLTGVQVFNLPEKTESELTRSIVYGNMPILFNKPISHLAFRDVGIEANKYYKPLKPLPNSQYLFDRIINFPLHSDLTDYELSLIFKKIEIEAKKCS